MFGGGGGLNPRKMQKMMEQMGIDVTELDVESAVLTLDDGSELVFDTPDVTRMDARGQKTYQVVGSPEEREAAERPPDEDTGELEEGDAEEGGIPEEDIALVAEQSGASPSAAREALEATGGDLAAAIERLS